MGIMHLLKVNLGPSGSTHQVLSLVFLGNTLRMA